jgi:hypothetical protein
MPLSAKVPLLLKKIENKKAKLAKALLRNERLRYENQLVRQDFEQLKFVCENWFDEKVTLLERIKIAELKITELK